MRPTKTDPLSDAELRLIAQFLEDASDAMSNASCNDLKLEDTLEHRMLVLEYEQWNSGGREPAPEPRNGVIWHTDFAICGYLAARIRQKLE